MADQLPQFEDLTAVSAISGVAGVALIAQEVAALVSREAADMGGGRYQFHPAELQAVLNQWTDLYHTVSNAMTNVKTRVPHTPTVLAPGNESASTTVADAAHTTNTAYNTYLTSMQTYIKGYIDKLTTAMNNYLETEENNSGLSRSSLNHLQA